MPGSRRASRPAARPGPRRTTTGYARGRRGCARSRSDSGHRAPGTARVGAAWDTWFDTSGSRGVELAVERLERRHDVIEAEVALHAPAPVASHPGACRGVGH